MLAASCSLLVGCAESSSVGTVDNGGDEQEAAEKTVPDVAAYTSPGKPSAPVTMRYEVLGNPVVGAPVSINVEVDAPAELGPVNVRYSIADSGALVFQQGQVVDLELTERAKDQSQQLAVIPQREGRLYVNVSAEVQTEGGAMIKSMAIPIQVGSAPNQPSTNGALKEGPEGETVISLPAAESTN